MLRGASWLVMKTVARTRTSRATSSSGGAADAAVVAAQGHAAGEAEAAYAEAAALVVALEGLGGENLGFVGVDQPQVEVEVGFNAFVFDAAQDRDVAGEQGADAGAALVEAERGDAAADDVVGGFELDLFAGEASSRCTSSRAPRSMTSKQPVWVSAVASISPSPLPTPP